MIAFIVTLVIFVILFILSCSASDDYSQARIYGKSVIDSVPKTNKTAVMFDIDGTLLRGPNPIAPIIELCNYAKSKKIKVVIITARPDIEYSRTFTRNQLNKHGIKYDQLFFCPPDEKKVLKETLDLDFILSVGDLWTDIDGSNSGKGIKLK